MSRFILLLLPLVLGSPARRSLDSDGDVVVTADSAILDPLFSFTNDEASLNEMFREVEELMEDTQSKLQNAVKEMEAEDVSSRRVPSLVPEDLPLNYHNASITETKIGNKTIETQQEIVKECIIDEDCKPGNYCHFADSEYKCLPCKAKEVCTRDGECCSGQLCVWGQCSKSSRGERGTICERQQDCNPGLCCSVQPDLLFPVCTSLPMKGELCHDSSTQLLDFIGWELEPDGVLDRCPCANGLVCQPQNQALVSLCEEPTLKETRRSDAELLLEDLPFDSLMPGQEFDYVEAEIMPTVFGTEVTYDKEPEFVPDLPFDI
ncbi:dickkopf-related protein 3 isoform 2-T2 [Discoglossus pictus]